MNKIKQSYTFFIIFILLGSGGCSSISGTRVDDNVTLIIAEREMQDDELLDISIIIFDPGELPENKNKQRGLSDKIRQAEARYIPIQLKYTLQQSGYWGVVHLAPDENKGSDITINGKIENSDGESISLKIHVTDATNKEWYSKTYKETVQYDEQGKTEPEKKDLFQNLYYEISNDLIKYRKKLTARELLQIQETADLRFAIEMAPEIYSSYLSTNSKGQYAIIRLPAANDPMIKRLKSIQVRHEMLLDTLNNYYDGYYADVWDSYDSWRRYRSEELQIIRGIERKALAQKIIGTAAIIGAIALGASNNSDIRYQTSALRSIMVAGGAYAVYEGIKTGNETNINKEAIEELGESFASDAEPLVVDVKGESVRLTGTAKEQYGKWRQILKDIYKQETGY